MNFFEKVFKKFINLVGLNIAISILYGLVLVNRFLLILSIFDWKNLAEKVVLIDPHDIFFSTFAQSGFIGITGLMYMLFIFISTDIACVRKKDYLVTLVALTFWSLFIYSLLNPALSLQYFTLFWVLRAIIAVSVKTAKR